jgi:hypothetical protein
MSTCSGCGKSLEDGVRFCTNCGIRVQPGAASPATSVDASGNSSVAASAPARIAPEPQPVPIVPVSDMAPAPRVSPFVIIVCVVLVLLIGFAVLSALYLHSQSGPKVAAQKSEASAQSVAQDDYIHNLNLGSYPAATPVAIVTLNGESVVAGFVTRDRPDQVMQYYKVRFPIAEVSSENGTSHLAATLPNDQKIRIDAQPQGANTQVKIVRVR